MLWLIPLVCMARPATGQDQVTVTGRLVGEDGAGIAGAVVNLGGNANQSDAQGRLQVRVPATRPSGRFHDLEVHTRERVARFKLVLGPPPDGSHSLSLGEIAVLPPGALVVRVVNQLTGEVREQGTVSARSLTQLSRRALLLQQGSTQVDPATGEYRLELQPGSYQVAYDWPHEVQASVLIESDIEQFLELRGLFTHLQLGFDPGPFRLDPSRLLKLRGSDGTLHADRGGFHFYGLPLDDYTLVGLGEDLEPITRTFGADEGPVPVTLRPSSGLKLLVTWPETGPSPRPPVIQVRRRLDGLWQRGIQVLGEAPLGERVDVPIPPGTWLVEVVAPILGSRRELVEIAAGPRAPLDLVLRADRLATFEVPREYGDAETELLREGFTVSRPRRTRPDGTDSYFLQREEYVIRIIDDSGLATDLPFDLRAGIPRRLEIPAPPGR